MKEIKAKFHYAIEVADLVSDLAFDKFVRVWDQLATFFGRKQVADRFELSWHVEIDRTCLRPIGNQVCDMDSVMEFGLSLRHRHVGRQLITDKISLFIHRI